MVKVDALWLLDALRIRHKRLGGYAWASCPSKAHSDSSPSWRMIINENDPRYGQHRCYGCGFGGYAVHLVAEISNLSLKEARNWLAEKGNSGPLPREVEIVSSHGLLPPGYAGLSLPPGSMSLDELPLEDWPPRAIAYLAARNVTEHQIQRWGLAVVPAEADSKYRGRIILPARDAIGRLHSWTARSYIGSSLRYMTPNLEQGADQSAIFGAEFWSSPPELCVIAEGTFDALAIERAAPAVDIAVLLGSHITPLHLLRLSQFPNAIIATDPDSAGNRAYQKLSEGLQRSTQTVRLELPQGKDPAELDPDDLLNRIFRARQALPSAKLGTSWN